MCTYSFGFQSFEALVGDKKTRWTVLRVSASRVISSWALAAHLRASHVQVSLLIPLSSREMSASPDIRLLRSDHLGRLSVSPIVWRSKDWGSSSSAYRALQILSLFLLRRSVYGRSGIWMISKAVRHLDIASCTLLAWTAHGWRCASLCCRCHQWGWRTYTFAPLFGVNMPLKGFLRIWTGLLSILGIIHDIYNSFSQGICRTVSIP